MEGSIQIAATVDKDKPDAQGLGIECSIHGVTMVDKYLIVSRLMDQLHFSFEDFFMLRMLISPFEEDMCDEG